MEIKKDYCFFRNCNIEDYSLLVAIICGFECEHYKTSKCPYWGGRREDEY